MGLRRKTTRISLSSWWYNFWQYWFTTQKIKTKQFVYFCSTNNQDYEFMKKTTHSYEKESTFAGKYHKSKVWVAQSNSTGGCYDTLLLCHLSFCCGLVTLTQHKNGEFVWLLCLLFQSNVFFAIRPTFSFWMLIFIHFYMDFLIFISKPLLEMEFTVWGYIWFAFRVK